VRLGTGCADGVWATVEDPTQTGRVTSGFSQRARTALGSDRARYASRYAGYLVRILRVVQIVAEELIFTIEPVVRGAENHGPGYSDFCVQHEKCIAL
jgi:hypothetical protein